jgi:putative ABC transport system substrate-binding protein
MSWNVRMLGSNIPGLMGDSYSLTIQRKEAGPVETRRRIFVLFPRRSSAYDVAMAQILQVFEEKNINADFTLVNFDNDHVRGRKAMQLADKSGFELVFSMGSQSTAWLWANYRGGALPVISVCSKDPVVLGQAQDYESGTGTNFAFTSLNMPIEVQMAYVLELKPNLKNLSILVNSQNISAVQTQAKPIADYARKRGIRVLDVEVEDPKHAGEELAYKVRDAVRTMRKNDPTLDSSVFWITGSTAVFREIRAINANSDRVPVLSVVPDVVKEGEDSAVLSIGISFQSNAHLAAIYGADVLAGRAKVGDLKVGIVSPPDIAINFLKAREIGLEIPFSFFESASFVYDYDGRIVRNNGKAVVPVN